MQQLKKIQGDESVLRDHSPWEAGEVSRVKVKWQPQGLQMLSSTLQGDESENLLRFRSGDASPALPQPLSCLEDILPGSLAFFHTHSIWRHNSYLFIRLGLLKDFQKRSLQDMWYVKGNRGAFKTINFNCRGDLMFSRQKVHGGTC